ncbi:SRPBCC domain-containing protein [Micrococcaceae bacterium Sec5.7]
MTGITPAGIEIDRDFTAPPSAVFAAWTNAEHFAKWFGGGQVDVPADRLDYNPVVGGSWSATMVLPDGNTIAWAGDFLEITPVERLVLTMTDNPSSAQRAEVVVELSPTPTGTHMRMTQETPGFTTEMRQGTLAGWQTFMDVLTTIAEAA